MEFLENEINKIHKNQIYSKLDQIPKGDASKEITEGCMVLEGGAFRGLYTQGALDLLMENNINLSTTIGVSAGALSGISYVSGQIGRSARANLKYRHDSEYIGLKAFGESGSPLNLNFLFDNLDEIEPFNKERFESNLQGLIAVATNCNNGNTEYFEKGKCGDIYSALKASASMPFISQMIDVDGKPCLDGGCSCKIPYQWALDKGFKKIIIIKTRERGYRKEEENILKLIEAFYRKYPEFAKKLSESTDDYNKQCDEIDKLEEEKRAFVLAPSEPVTVGRLESDMEKLGDLYWLGYNDAKNKLEEIKKYLKR